MAARVDCTIIIPSPWSRLWFFPNPTLSEKGSGLLWAVFFLFFSSAFFYVPVHLLGPNTNYPMSQEVTTNSAKNHCIIELLNADGGVITEKVDVVMIKSSGERLKISYDSVSKIYALPDVTDQFITIETEHSLYEPSGTYCSSLADTIKLYLFKKGDAYYGDLSGKTYYTRYPDRLFIEFNQAPLSQPVQHLLDSLGLVGREDSLSGEEVYLRKDGEPFARYNCRELAVLRTNPLVKSVCCAIREKSYMFYIEPSDPDMLGYASSVKQRKNMLRLTSEIELYYPSNIPQSILDSIASQYGLIKSLDQSGAEGIGLRNCTIYSCKSSIGEGVLDIATTINRGGIINAIPHFEVKLEASGFPIPRKPATQEPNKKKKKNGKHKN
jgi:hypothetical protein